ncbi:MAG TPA: metallophosphoesterase [Intrasporangium sp.]|uniref:metallophosphoesterase family protein n=1 Tax=Intrasporangium sp. TaxID=1925024 RepID=UPI002D76780B|nr:metallophosphoesterase [Intrasporangium sp.]HET7399284.1 metallophosphoesterase [Intrasporangium sp.]
MRIRLARAAAAAVVSITAVVGVTAPTSTAAVVPVVVMAAGDIAGSGTNAGSTGDVIRANAPKFVLPLGDNAYELGSLSDYNTKYAPTWGSFKAVTRPVPGNHDYQTAGAAGYTSYFGPVVKNATNGALYYAWDIGNGWRGYALNSEVPMSSTSPQYAWLKSDLAAHPGAHILATWHQARYTSPNSITDYTAAAPIWALLQTAHADIVLSGHNHNYERFAKMNSTGALDAAGIRSFVVGTGGKSLSNRSSKHVGSQVFDRSDFGVLKLQLFPDHYLFAFIASGRGLVGTTLGDTGRKGVVIDSGSNPTNL